MAEQAPAVRERFRWIERSLALATLVAAAAYVALRMASILFYGSLGLTPEELGLGELDLLARSIGLLAVIFVVWAVVAYVVAYVIFLLVVIRIWNVVVVPLENTLFQAPKWYRSIVIGVAAGSLVVGLWRLRPLAFGPVLVIPLGGLIAYLRWGRREGWLERARSDTRKGLREFGSRISPVWRPTMLVAAVLSVVTAIVAAIATASAAAGAVQAGQAYRSDAVPWRADPATVRWIAQPASGDPLVGRCLLYLGQSNAVVVLYDARSHSIVRVPSTQVVLLVHTSVAACSAE